MTPDSVTLLSSWSIAIQGATVGLLAVFFLTLARAVRLAEVRFWAWAWVANTIALAAVFVEQWVPDGWWLASRVVLIVYLAGKTSYVLLMLAGTQNHVLPGIRLRLRATEVTLVIAGWSLGAGIFSPRLTHVQLAQAMMVGMVLTVGAVWVFRHRRTPLANWLGGALLIEGLLFLHYVPLLSMYLWWGGPLPTYMNFSSLLDAGAELLVGLGCLVALESSTSDHLRHLNAELETSQERLRQLVDLDPLTGLANRRALRSTLLEMRGGGGALIFLDLDNFKAVNDRHGHLVGDETLRHVARAIEAEFRTDDAIFRWGGDEFLVVAPGLGIDAARDRTENLRAALRQPGESVPAVELSFGVALLPPGGQVDEALHQADEAMYRDKRGRGFTKDSSAIVRMMRGNTT